MTTPILSKTFESILAAAVFGDDHVVAAGDEHELILLTDPTIDELGVIDDSSEPAVDTDTGYAPVVWDNDDTTWELTPGEETDVTNLLAGAFLNGTVGFPAPTHWGVRNPVTGVVLFVSPIVHGDDGAWNTTPGATNTLGARALAVKIGHVVPADE